MTKPTEDECAQRHLDAAKERIKRQGTNEDAIKGAGTKEFWGFADALIPEGILLLVIAYLAAIILG